MKKLITLFVVMLVSYQLSHAQSTPAVGSSYTTNVVTDVFPYQAGRKPKVDSTIHFKLNVNTKFQIVDIRTISGAINGYIITPWNFSDSARYHNKKISKADFYRTKYVKSDTSLAKLKLLQDSLKSLKATIAALDTQRKIDTLKVTQSNKAVADTSAAVKAKNQMLFNSLAYLNPNTAIAPVKKNDISTKNKVQSFTAKQSAVKAHLDNGNEPPEALKQQLIEAAKPLRFTNQGVNKSLANYQAAKANLDTVKQKAHADSVKLTRTKRKYENALASIKSLVNNNQGQSQPGLKFDKDAYRITKKQINDVLDTPENVNNQAAKLDNLAFLDSWANRWTFFLPATSFSENKVVPIYTRSDTFTWGFLSLPLKMRFGNSRGPFDFEQNLQFGITAGDKHQFAKTADVSINYLGGVSVVNVPLKDSTSTTAVSLSIGSMFQYGKFQIGLFGGVDLAGSKSAQFNYQGKPWIGIAIGVSLFGEGQTTATAAVPNQD
jgi:hypothetical protein